jgi:hypothetical protein
VWIHPVVRAWRDRGRAPGLGRIAATDLNVSLTAELKSQNTTEGGITLGAKNLYGLIANAPGEEVTAKNADNHWAEIKSGKVTYRIVGMPTETSPRFRIIARRATRRPRARSSRARLIERTLFSVCTTRRGFWIPGGRTRPSGSGPLDRVDPPASEAAISAAKAAGIGALR